MKNIRERIRKIEARIGELDLESLERIESNISFILRRIEFLESRTEEQLLKYVAKQIIEEAEMSSMPFDDVWERVGNYFCDRYESKIAEMTEETQRQLAMVCLARMELITQSTINKLEKLSKEAIEMIKNKESKNNE